MTVLLTLLAACVTWDGTWIFTFDANSEIAGDCAEDTGDDSTTTQTGNAATFVDIYRTGDGGVVVLLEQALKGEVSGNAIDCEWSQQTESDTYKEKHQISMSGTTEAGVLSGEVEDETWAEDEEGADYNCRETWGYTAERTVSPADRYVGN